MQTPPTGQPIKIQWPGEAETRVPYRVFLDSAIYEREQERLFRGPVWNYVGLEAEISNVGDFKATFIGDTPIVITRGRDGSLNAFVNRCAHRGALVCRKPRGNTNTHVCVYHQWSYNLAGDLIGVPFRKGIDGKGGYRGDFDTAQHSLHKLNIASYQGLIFVSFARELQSLEEYLGQEMRPWLDRLFARPIEVLGYSRQHIRANWKLYAENVRDPYHASLLHLFHTTFGLYRSSMGGGVIMDEEGRHDMLHSYKRTEEEETAAYKDAGLRTYNKAYGLADPSLLQSRQELEPQLATQIQTIFPGLVLQQIQNTLATRQILPKAPDQFELILTYFGYQDDDDELRAIRLKQANFVGPAGLISMEDGHAAEIVQQAILRDRDASSYIGFGGEDVGDQENLLTETAIRGFWHYYRDVMGFDASDEDRREGRPC